jgi:DNA-binding GntR family transcriptional regulator
MVNLLEVRIHLEELAFRLASKKMTPEIEHELQQRLADIQKAVRTKDHILTAEADLKFHKTIWKASGNPLLVNTLDRICVSVYAFIGHQRRAAGEKLAIVSHDNLLKALESGKPERIAESLREHLDPESFIPASVVD